MMFETTNHQTNCPECAGIMQPRHNQDYVCCRACNTYAFPQPLEHSVDPIVASGRTLEFQCPTCHVDLEVGKLHDMVEVCFCQNCRGFVVASPSLHPLIHELRANYQGEDDQPRPLNPAELDQVIHCPTCFQAMETHPYYGPGAVVINSCTGCEINWMNHGELALIMRAPGPRPEIDSSPFVKMPTVEDPVDPVQAELGKFVSLFAKINRAGL